MGTHPLSKTLLKWMGEDTTRVPEFVRSRKSLPRTLPPGDPAVGVGCTAATGSVFNLEPAGGDPNTGLNFPLPQNEESVDFLPNEVGSTATGPDLVVEGANDFRGLFAGGLGSSLSGYYVHRIGTASNCAVNFEGGMPALSAAGEDIYGFGDPVVSADPLRHQVFYASIGIGASRIDINLYKTTTANLTNAAICPAGTHTDLDAAACWPTAIGIDPQGFVTLNNNNNGNPFPDKPHVRVDEALPCTTSPCASGTHVGGGDVYVAYTEFNNLFFGSSQINLVACNNSLTACSRPETISSGFFQGGPTDFHTQFPHISVRPDGTLSITYIDVTQSQSGHIGFSIKYVACTPSGAPTAPTCDGGSPGFPGTPSLVLTDANAIPFSGFPLSGEGFRIATYPKNDYQVETNGHIWQYIVWDRCRVPLLFGGTCPDSDVIGIAADTGLPASPAPYPFQPLVWSHAFAVNSTAGSHQYMPWMRTDASRNIISIAYYTNQADPLFNHRPLVDMNQILPCAGTVPCPVGAPFAATTTVDEPQADNLSFVFAPGFGDYIGIAARGTATGASRAYLGYTANFRVGTTQGLVAAADEDNYIQQLAY